MFLSLLDIDLSVRDKMGSFEIKERIYFS